MKIEWKCGCGLTHHLEPSEAAAYACRFCGHKYGEAAPVTAEAAPQQEATQPEQKTEPEKVEAEKAEPEKVEPVASEENTQ